MFPRVGNTLIVLPTGRDIWGFRFLPLGRPRRRNLSEDWEGGLEEGMVEGVENDPIRRHSQFGNKDNVCIISPRRLVYERAWCMVAR